jgi:hypothetical protein
MHDIGPGAAAKHPPSMMNPMPRWPCGVTRDPRANRRRRRTIASVRVLVTPGEHGKWS